NPHSSLSLLRHSHQSHRYPRGCPNARVTVRLAGLPRNPIARLLDRRQPSAWMVLSGAALLVGVLSGAGIWLFELLIEWASHGFALLAQGLAPFGAWTHALVTAAGGLIVGLILHF